MRKIVLFVFIVILIPLPAVATAQVNLALDSYTCADFLRDSKAPPDGTHLLKSLMMISWATGYAAAFQQKSPHAGAKAIILMAATLGDVCRKRPGKTAVDAITQFVAQFATSKQHIEHTRLKAARLRPRRIRHPRRHVR